MRNLIDYDLELDAVALVCSVACDMDESCINFLTSAASVAVILTTSGGSRTETVKTVNGSACFTLPETLLRTAGTFTVKADGKNALVFIVERTTSTGKPLTLCEVNGKFYVRCSAESSGEGVCMPWCLEIDENGDLLLHYLDGGTVPDMAINADGDLILTIEG